MEPDYPVLVCGHCGRPHNSTGKTDLKKVFNLFVAFCTGINVFFGALHILDLLKKLF